MEVQFRYGILATHLGTVLALLAPVLVVEGVANSFRRGRPLLTEEWGLLGAAFLMGIAIAVVVDRMRGRRYGTVTVTDRVIRSDARSGVVELAWESVRAFLRFSSWGVYGGGGRDGIVISGDRGEIVIFSSIQRWSELVALLDQKAATFSIPVRQL